MSLSTWMLTIGGTEHHLCGVGMALNEFDIESIAHSLSIINRFTGHTKRPYSVAEHSIVCVDIAEHLGLPAYVQLACLMHDAHEAFVGDISSPAKWAMGRMWDDFERTHAGPLRRWFGLQTTFVAHRRAIHAVDLMALATERRDLTAWDADRHEPWAVLDTPGAVVPPADFLNLASASRKNMCWSEHCEDFLRRFHALRAQVSAMQRRLETL